MRLAECCLSRMSEMPKGRATIMDRCITAIHLPGGNRRANQIDSSAVQRSGIQFANGLPLALERPTRK